MDPILENGLVSAMKDEIGVGVFGTQVSIAPNALI